MVCKMNVTSSAKPPPQLVENSHLDFAPSKCLSFKTWNISFRREREKGWNGSFSASNFSFRNLYSHLLRHCVFWVPPGAFDSLFKTDLLFTLVSCYRRTMADDVFILTTIFTFWHFNIMTESAERWKFSGRKQGGRNTKKFPRDFSRVHHFAESASKKIWKAIFNVYLLLFTHRIKLLSLFGHFASSFSFFFRAMSGEEIFR